METGRTEMGFQGAMAVDRRRFLKAAGAATCACLARFPSVALGASAGEGLKLATFQCNATPPLGDTLIWTTPLAKVLDTLLLKGVVLEDGGKRYVLCAIDWCLLCNESERVFRETLARAVGTDSSCVSVHCVHQHTAPYADEDAHRLLDGAGATPHLTKVFLDGLRTRMGKAAAGAMERLEPVDRVGYGAAYVDRVASQRRLKASDGKIISRFSAGGRDPKMAEWPEGYIDPQLKTVSFARGEKVLARLHYYATHPQTHSCDGSASADFVGMAREAREREEGVFQLYFTGCAGNVTVGKYNDGTLPAREALARRLQNGMRTAAIATRFVPADRIVWRKETLMLPVRADDAFVQESRRNLSDSRAEIRVYRGAMRLAAAARAGRPFGLSSLQIGQIRIVHLPGEPMLEFQTYAQSCTPDDFVAVAGYGDCASAYVCTDQAFAEGGYEPDDSNLAAGTESLLKDAIRRLLGHGLGANDVR